MVVKKKAPVKKSSQRKTGKKRSTPKKTSASSKPAKRFVTTKREDIEKALQDSEERYRAVVEDQTEIISRFYPDGTYIFVNDVFCRFFGKSKEKLIGMKWFPDAHSDDLEIIKAKLAAMSQSNPVVLIENRVFAGDGDLRWMQFINRGFYDKNGNLLEIQSVGRDITERKQMELEVQRSRDELEIRVKERTAELESAVELLRKEIIERKQVEEALRNSESKYRALFNEAPDGIVLIDAKTGIHEAFNDRAYKKLGYTKEEFKKIKVSQYEVIESPEEIEKHIKQIIMEGAHTFETKHRRKDGKILNMLVSGKALTVRGKFFIQGIYTDITERKKAEEALRKSELWLANIYNSLEEAVLVVTPDRILQNINNAAEKMFGYTKDEFYEHSTDILHVDHDHYLEFGRRLKDAFGRGETAFFEFEAKRKNGEVFPTEHTVSLLKDKSGNSIGIVSVVRDITLRRKTEQALWESEERFRTIVEQSPISIQILAPDGQTIKVNRAWEKLWGITLDDLRDYNILHDKQLERLGILSYLRKAFAGETVFVPAAEYDAAKTLGKGTRRWVQAHVYPIKSGSGNIRVIVLMHEDITERKNAEDALIKANEEIESWSRGLEIRVKEKTMELVKSQTQLIQSEKLSAMGQMAGGLAHELNSPLGGLLPMIEKYRGKAGEGSRERSEFSLMLNACEHMAKIISDFGAFSRKSKGKFYKLDLNEVIEDTLSFSISRFKQKRIRLIKKYKETLPAVLGEKTELQQVVLNMITNACDAVSDTGELTIKTGISKDKKNVIMEFIDNGTGIEKGQLEKIFDPFYTTKRPGRGTGLGLSVSYSIIKKHGGNISVESGPGKGTKFSICLPAVKADNKVKK